MSIASTRAQAIAQILWELKKAEKLATLTSIANRVGFAPGANGRTVSTLLKTVRRGRGNPRDPIDGQISLEGPTWE